MGAFGRLIRKRRLGIAQLLDQLDGFEQDAREISQPKGQVRICTEDGAELEVVMMMGAEDGGDLVYMVCRKCGAKYVEQADLAGGSV